MKEKAARAGSGPQSRDHANLSVTDAPYDKEITQSKDQVGGWNLEKE